MRLHAALASWVYLLEGWFPTDQKYQRYHSSCECINIFRTFLKIITKKAKLQGLFEVNIILFIRNGEHLNLTVTVTVL